MVAKTWLKKDESQDESLGEYHVHHIFNDGYNNTAENLMFIRKKIHSEIHSK